MNYDLAKELKDEGFPQKWDDGMSFYRREEDGRFVVVSPKRRDNTPLNKLQDGAKIPTLEELIEACGDGFLGLSRWQSGNNWRWFCNDDETGAVTSEGPTPTEAVARLWLALNKKV